MTLPKIPDDERNWNAIEIFLFSNGQEYSPPRKYNLSSETLREWDGALNHLAQSQYGSELTLHKEDLHYLVSMKEFHFQMVAAGIIIYSAPKIELFTLDGKPVNGPMELSDGSAYVAVKCPEDFTQTGYNNYLMKASRSWEKRQERKLPSSLKAPDKGNPKTVNSPRIPQRQVKTPPNVKSKNLGKTEETNITSTIAKEKNTRIYSNINTKRPIFQTKDKNGPKVTTQVDIKEENKRVNRKVSEVKTDNDIEMITTNKTNTCDFPCVPIDTQKRQSIILSKTADGNEPITQTLEDTEKILAADEQNTKQNNTRDKSISISRGGVVNLKLNIRLKNNDILKREYNDENLDIKDSNNSSVAAEKASQVNIDLNFSGLNLPKYDNAVPPATDNSPTIMIFRCNCNDFGLVNKIASYEQEYKNATFIKLAAINENNAECCKCDMDKVQLMKDQTQQLINSLTANAFDLGLPGQYLTPKLDNQQNSNSKEPQPILISDIDKQGQDEVPRSSINGKKTLDKSSQTDWNNTLLESRCEPDGHYTFHLPPLHVIKNSGVQQFNK